MNKKKKKREFSKTLLIQESILIWIYSIAFLGLAYVSILRGYLGSLPWLTAMASCPWAAYAISQACYYNKSKAENCANGVIYETAIREAQKLEEYVPNIDGGI